MPIEAKLVLACTAIIVLVVGIAYVRTHRKLDRNHARTHGKLEEIHGEVKSTHLRQDAERKEIAWLHVKADKIRRGFALLFHGDEPASKRFADWWRSWYEP